VNRSLARQRSLAPRAIPWLAFACAALAGCEREPLRISGTVEARRVTVSAEAAARLVAVHAREGQHVEEGELLAELECSLPQAQRTEGAARVREAEARLALLRAGSRKQELAAAEAELAIARAELELAQKGARAEVLAQLEASIAALDARIRLAELSAKRAEELVGSGSAAQALADQAQAELDQASAERRRVEAELAEARAGARPEELEALEQRQVQASERLELLREGARPEELAAAEAALATAQGALAAIEELVRRCRIVAPVAGAVEVVDVEPGELVVPGTPVLAIAREGVLRVRTYAPQHVIGELAVNEKLPVIVDGHPGQPLEGRVERIWDEPEFTAGNVQTPEDRMLLVYRVDLELAPSSDPPLRPGSNVVVDFERGTR